MLNFPLIDADATGKQIRQLREKNGLTVKELEAKLHVTQRAIYRWEEGKSLPQIESLFALSKLLGVSITEILVLKD